MSDCNCSYCQRHLTPEDRARDKLLNEAAQREFLGGVSHMWLRRRAKDPAFRFPEVQRCGRRVSRWASDLAAWVASPHAAREVSDAAD